MGCVGSGFPGDAWWGVLGPGFQVMLGGVCWVRVSFLSFLPMLTTCYAHIHVNKSKQGKANGSTQGRQLISKKKAELP